MRGHQDQMKRKTKWMELRKMDWRKTKLMVTVMMERVRAKKSAVLIFPSDDEVNTAYEAWMLMNSKQIND